VSSTDTINTTLSRPLTVRVVDDVGAPCVGCIVRFESIPSRSPFPPHFVEPLVYLREPASDAVKLFLVDTADGAGHASVRLLYGYIAGPGHVAVSVPEFGYTDTVQFDIQPGRVAGVSITPEDTATYVGGPIPLQARQVDRIGNPTEGAVTIEVDAGPAYITNGGVTLATVGRVRIVARAGEMRDTAWISAVPPARLASQRFDIGNGGPISLDQVQTDGRRRERLTRGVDNDMSIQGWEWTPDGRDLVLARGTFINLLTQGGIERPVVEIDGSLLPAARMSRDGQWIYVTQQASGQPHTGMLRVRSDGSVIQPIGPHAFGLSRYPAPSHDGRSVAYVADRFPCGDECIYVLDLATNQDRVYPGRGWLVRGRIVAWSPVEDLIAYAGGSRIAVIRSDGTGDRTLVDDIHAVTWMDWSPDGRWLVVAGYGPVLLIEVETGLRLPIAQLFDYGSTAWRP
jgi:hypothetical protein